MDTQFDQGISLSARIMKHTEVIIVGILLAFYLFLANYFYWGPTFITGGGIAALPTSGGSDPYYNFLNILHILNYHTQLVYDPTLNYPLGTTNPRNPFFHWFVVLVAEILSPFFGAQQAAFYAFEEFNAVFGALLIIPVYLITRDIFGKNAAGAAAILYTLMPSNLSAGILSGGRMHTPELIFAFFAIYFFEKALRLTQKSRIIENLTDYKTYHLKVINYFNTNRIPSIYALLAGASLGGLMLSWQGYAYIEAIILIYVAIQLIVNLILKRPTGYLTFYTALFVALGFLMGAYYYQALGEGPGWYNAEVLIGLVIVGFGIVIGLIGRRPWVLIIPLLIAVVVAGFVGIEHFSPALLNRLLSGEGYFIKSRLYETIAEASAPSLGPYIGGFGIAQFLLGMAGIGYAVYLFLRERTDELLFILVFSIVSIYMSFAAARFNITAAPAYAILGGAILIFFSKLTRIEEVRKKKPSTTASPIKSIGGNIKWLHVVLVLLVTVLVVAPAGYFMVSASVPYNTASQVDQQIANSLPSFLKTNNSTIFVGGLSTGVTNGSTPLSQSFAWLRTQDSNLPVQDRPAYVSWWDYGFQELYQGQHPTVADDFQQGVEVAGQTLLAQNESQIVSLFIGRLLQSNYHNGNFSSNVTASLIDYLGYSEYHNITAASANPNQFSSQVLDHPSIYGQYISGVSSANLYFAFIKGELATKYQMPTLVNLYQKLTLETGYNIKYIQVNRNMFPSSGTSTGIFYAPAYLTDSPSYSSNIGGIIPTEYYNVYATTTNGTFPLSTVPVTATITGYNIVYTSQFYNSSIYRFVVGYPPSSVGQTNGIPGLDYGTTSYTVMPAWNMSNFEIVYESIPYNPYKDYASHPNAWTTIPLQQAYLYQKEGKGTVVLFPPATQFVSYSDPIVAYYPGAIIQGRVTTATGAPAPGAYVTVFDQYGIPHEVVRTNSNGYYNLSAVPGNDTIYYSYGTLDPRLLVGSSTLGATSIYISQNQANRVPTGYNSTTGLPDYYITKNFQLQANEVDGSVAFIYQHSSSAASINSVKITSGNVILKNSTYDLTYNASIVNGFYSVPNIPPITYEASVYTNGQMYSNVSLANATTRGTVGYNLQIHFDVVFAGVTIAGKPVSGVSLSAYTSNGRVIYSSPSNSTGVAVLWVTPGQYNVSLSGNGISTLPTSVSFTAWGKNQTLSLTPLISAYVSIAVDSSSAKVILYTNGQYNEPIYLQQLNGRYVANLPYGIYTVYAADSTGSYFSTLKITSNLYENITLLPSAHLTLNSTLGSTPTYSGSYEIMSGNGLLEIPFSTTHLFSNIEVPEGAYSISGTGTSTAGTYYGLFQGTLFGVTSVSLTLGYKNSISSYVYDTSKYTSYNSQSAVSNGLLILDYASEPVYFATVGSSGLTQLYYPTLATGELSVNYSSAFYSNSSSSVGSSNVYIPTTLVKVKTSVYVSAQSLASAQQDLSLTSITTQLNYTLSNGLASIEIPVGVYSVSLNEKNSVLTPYPSYLTIAETPSSLYTIDATQTSNFTVSGAQVAELFLSNGTLYSPTGIVSSGPYQVYSFNPALGVNITDVNIAGNSTLSPTYESYYYLNLSNSAGLNAGTYSISYQGHILNITNPSIALPQGQYTVNYTYLQSNSTGSFAYYGQSTVNLNGNLGYSVQTKMQQVLTELSGSVVYGGTPASYSTVYLLDQSGNVIQQANTNVQGDYTMLAPSGVHNLYITNSGTKAAFLGALTIPGFASKYYVNATLAAAAYLTVNVNLGSSIISNPVNVSTTTASLIFNSSAGSVLIPSGIYTIKSTISSSEQAVNGTSISISYSESVTQLIASDVTIPLTLQKTIVHGFQVDMFSKVANINVSKNVTYSFSITNIGNNNENITLTSGSSEWKQVFNQTYINLEPGQIGYLSVNITLLKNVQAGLNNVPMTLSYSGGSTPESLPVYVNSTLNYNLSAGGLPLTIGNKVYVPVELNNTGNSPIAVGLSINETYLQQNGWNGTILLNNVSVNSVTLSYGQTETVYVSLTPTGTTVYFPISFTVYGSNATVGDKNVTLSIANPSVAHISPYPTGVNILSNYTGSPLSNLITGIVIIAVAVVGGLVIAAYRGRRR